MNYPPKPIKASAIDVIRAITKQSDPVAVSAAVDAALLAQYANARTYQLLKKRTFNLSPEEFFALITPSRRQRMEQRMAEGRFERFMKSNYGYVLTWKSRAAFKAGVMDASTPCYVNREDAERACQFGPGDEHTADSKDLIRKSRTGKKASDATRAKMSRSKVGKKLDAETCAKISAGLKGRAKSPEQIEKMREAAKARWAKKRVEENRP
ncbi:hypothetical protein [Rhizobium sp. Leaf262]|uniref:hypothetical protein n=1 Tax=Rhizobium sp. Leaf262 TaxID=1736312 RepID=UPI0007160400|nr:hypothetical protein [Rhizobium sp. Leaf262]KQO79467.1 hypothetical protein ASF29_23440 [Rhizobium sp. Leaf262]